MDLNVGIQLRRVLNIFDPSLIIKKRADEYKEYHDFGLIAFGEDPLNDELIYLCSSNYLPSNVEELTNCCLLIRDKGGVDYSRLRCDYILLSPEINIQDTRNSIRTIFTTRKSQICYEFRQHLETDGSLSGILELASEELQCPMLICNENNCTLIHVGSDYSVDPSYAALADQGVSPQEMLQAARQEKVEPLILRTDYPVLIDIGKYRTRRRIFSWIYVNGFRRGFIVALEGKRTFTSLEVLLMSVICNTIASLAEGNTSRFGQPVHLEELLFQDHLRSLFTGKPTDLRSPYPLLYDALLRNSHLIAIRADRSKEEDRSFFTTLFQLLSSRQYLLCQMDSVCALLVEENEKNTITSFVAKLDPVLKKYSINAGISKNPSEGQTLDERYREAVLALEICEKPFYVKNTAFYRNVVFFIMLSELPEEKIQNYYDTALDRILSYDQQKGTQYYQTLYTYLCLGHNRLATSEQLFLHRNTVSYQLKKIEQLLEFSPDDIECGLSLYFSFKINEMRGISPS